MSDDGLVVRVYVYIAKRDKTKTKVHRASLLIPTLKVLTARLWFFAILFFCFCFDRIFVFADLYVSICFLREKATEMNKFFMKFIQRNLITSLIH